MPEAFTGTPHGRLKEHQNLGCSRIQHVNPRLRFRWWVVVDYNLIS